MAALFVLEDTNPIHCPIWRLEVYDSEGHGLLDIHFDPRRRLDHHGDN